MNARSSDATGGNDLGLLESVTRFPGLPASCALTKDELIHILSLLLQYQITYRTQDETRCMNQRALMKVTAMVDTP